MSSARTRRIGTIAATGFLALTAVGTLGANAANAAKAYPQPAGAASGTCTPASQEQPVGGSLSNLACTFTFTNYKGAAAKNAAVTYTTSAGTVSGDLATDASGSASATVSVNACNAVGTTSYTVKASINSSDANTSGQAFATVTCDKPVVTVTAGGCVDKPGASTIDGYELYKCSWTTGGAKDGTAVSYAEDDSDPDGSAAFVFGGSKSVKSNAFSTSVYVDQTYTGPVTITGTVANTSTATGASADNTIGS